MLTRGIDMLPKSEKEKGITKLSISFNKGTTFAYETVGMG